MFKFIEIPVSEILFDSNVGINRTADDGLIASISKHGVLQPVVVYFTDGIPVLLSGHRRVDACKRLGLTHVPARVLEDAPDEPTRLAMQTVENTMRKNLAPAEELEAYQALLDIVSDEEAAVLLSQPVQRMQSARAINHSVRAREVIAESPGLDLFVAAELAGYEEAEDVPAALVEAAYKKISEAPSKAQHIIAELTDSVERLRDLNATVARLEADGFTVDTPDATRRYAYFERNIVSDFTSLSHLENDSGPISVESHKSCGGHVVVVFAPSHQGEECTILYGCSDYETWGHKLIDPKKAPVDEARARRQQAVNEEKDQFRRAEEVRERFVKDLLMRTQLPTGFLSVAVIGLSDHSWNDENILKKYFNDVYSVDAFCVTPDRVIRLLVARALERSLTGLGGSLCTPVSPAVASIERVQFLLRWLETAGYVLSDIEQSVVDDVFESAARRPLKEFE